MQQSRSALPIGGSNPLSGTLDIRPAIGEFIARDLLRRDGSNVSADTRLIDDGYLTSLETVQLVIFLEERFRLEIDPEDVTEENFQTLDAIASLVARKRGGAGEQV